MTDWTDSQTRHDGGVAVSDEGDGCVVRLWGDVDAALRSQASAVMSQVLARTGPVVMDASRVEFIDSTGLAFLFQLVKVGAEDGRQVILRDPPVLLLDLLDVLDLSGEIPLDFSPGGHPLEHRRGGAELLDAPDRARR